MGITLVIAEKPSVARALREVIGGNRGYIVETCRGHILELADPESYDENYRRWDASVLPIIPAKWKLEIKEADLFNAIKARFDSGGISTVIHAGDPDAEGQAIVDEVLEMVGWTGRTLRILPNSVDAISLRREMDNPQDNAKFLNLGLQAKARARADWLVGMNLTRAMTKIISQGALVTIGRVQTPALSLLVRRQREIDNFVQQTFYTFIGSFSGRAGGRDVEFDLECEPDPRIYSRDEARKLASKLPGQDSVAKVEKRTSKRSAPMPFDLQSFQSEAEACYGWGMDRSLKALQESYEAGYTSYPRTDCRYLKEEQIGDVPRLVADVGGALGVPRNLLAVMKPSNRVYNSKKVTAHHGLAPSGSNPPASAKPDVIKAWRLVSAQFLRSLMPDSEYAEVRVSAPVTGDGKYEKLVFSRLFSKRTTSGCWSDFPFDKVADSMREPKPVQEIAPPGISNGDAVRIVGVDVREGKTTPPKPYTTVTLGEDMQNIWKYVQDEAMATRLKERGGIGTPATRTSIIEGLIRKNYAVEAPSGRKKILKPTALGFQLIDNSPAELHAPEITAQWEEALRMIGEGAYDIKQFEDRINRMVVKRIDQIRQMKAAGSKITEGAQKASGGSSKSNGQKPGKSAHARGRAGKKRKPSGQDGQA